MLSFIIRDMYACRVSRIHPTLKMLLVCMLILPIRFDPFGSFCLYQLSLSYWSLLVHNTTRRFWTTQVNRKRDLLSYNMPFLGPNIHIQILQTDLHTFSWRIGWENLVKDQIIIFLFVIILLILIDFAHDSPWISLGENWFWALLGLKGLI